MTSAPSGDAPSQAPRRSATPSSNQIPAGAASVPGDGAGVPGVQALAALKLEGRPPLGTGGGLPVAHLAPRTVASTMYCVVTPMDSRGRLADRSPLRILQWPPLLPIAVSVLGEGAMLVIPSRSGLDKITRQGHLRLPVAVRQALRLKIGDRLLAVACAERRLLLVHTMAALEAMIAAHNAAHLRQPCR